VAPAVDVRISGSGRPGSGSPSGLGKLSSPAAVKIRLLRRLLVFDFRAVVGGGRRVVVVVAVLVVRRHVARVDVVGATLLPPYLRGLEVRPEVREEPGLCPAPFPAEEAGEVRVDLPSQFL